MASNSKSTTLYSNNGYGYTLTASFNENSTSTSGNYSNITCTARLSSGNFSWSSSYNSTLVIYWHDNRENYDRQVASINLTSLGTNSSATASGTINVTHNTNGALSGYAYAYFTKGGTSAYTPNSGGVSTDWTALTNIPRYANINSFTVSKVNETTLSFSFTANSTIDYVWYSTNNGTNWTGKDITDGTSATFNVTGLSANTTYQCKIRVRRKDSQLTTDSSAKSQTTYNYPYVTAVGTSNLTIGNSQTLTLYNPLSRTVTIKMNKTNASGTQLYSGSTNKTSITFTPTASTLYASIPNNSSAKCVYSAIYSSSTKTTGQYTYSINANNCKPTFSNFTYSTNLDNLTGNNNTIINGKTTTTITISSSNKAVAKNSASILRYSIECGDSKVLSNYSTSDVTGLLQNCNSDIIRVTAIDSRGLETTVTKTVSTFKNYYEPTFAKTNVERKDGIEDIVYLSAEMNFWNYSFGSSNNSIQTLKYRSKESSSDTYGNWYTINLENVTVNNEKATLTDYLIYIDGVSTGFTVGVYYDVQIQITDKLSTKTSKAFTLPDGTVALSILKDDNGAYHIGINGMPDLEKTLKVHGTISNS